MFDFYYQVGNARRKSFHVKGDVCNIGSARNNDLVINARTIGKRHAELRLKTDGIHISDLGSLDGCWVNNERVMSHGPLSEFDEVSVGQVLINVSRSSMEQSENVINTKVSSVDEPSRANHLRDSNAEKPLSSKDGMTERAVTATEKGLVQ